MNHLSPSRGKKRGKRTGLFALIVLFIIGGVLLLKFGSYIPTLYGLLFQSKQIHLKKVEQNQRVNILLLGIGGGTHDGPLLTDTIIYASIDPEHDKVTLVSLPRDLWIPDLKAKVNTAYAYGEAKQKGGGITLSRAVIEKVLGQPVDYVFRLDFNGFVKAVDLVGGVDVTVDRTFDDYEYPISGKEDDDCGYTGDEFQKRATDSSQLDAFPCRYEHLHFDAGTAHMDGETALTFVRSRHATGSEGSDFARSKRQEKVISAFKDKVFSAGTYLNPIKLVSLYNVFEGSIDTDIQQDEYDDFIKLAKKMQQAKLQSVVIDAGDTSADREGLLDTPDPSAQYNWQWVVTPRAGDGNFTEIQAYVSCEIKVGQCSVTPTTTPVPSLSTSH